MIVRKRQRAGTLFAALVLTATGCFQTGWAMPGHQHTAGRRERGEDNRSARQGLIDAVVAQARRDQKEDPHQAEKNGLVYFALSFGSSRYGYRIKDWKLTAHKASGKQSGSGIVGGWANVSIDMLDSRRKSSVQGAEWLFHYRKGRWHRVALNEGPGYERKRLHELGMSDTQIRRLHLEVNDK